MKHTYRLAFAAMIYASGCGAVSPQPAAPKSSPVLDSDATDSNAAASTSKSLEATTNDPTGAETSSSMKPPATSGPLGTQPSATVGASNQSEQSASAQSAARPESIAAGPTSADRDEPGAGKCRESDAKLSLSVDRRSVSLEEGRLAAKMDGPICSLMMRITNRDGQPILEKTFKYTESERDLRWTPIPRDQIEKVEIRISARDGAYQSVFLIPWSVSIDHEEVQFDTNKAIIRESEVASLNDSLATVNAVLAKVEDKGLGTITLFIAGHTDTQGSDEHNLQLSRSRAQAIAAWFMKKGLCVPIAYEGFGETALKKLTADNVDEQANRRVDYILSVEPPTVKKGATPTWKWLSKGC